MPRSRRSTFLIGDAVGVPRDVVDGMKTALALGNSALVAVLDDQWVQDLENQLREAQARQILDARLMGDTATGAVPPPHDVNAQTGGR